MARCFGSDHNGIADTWERGHDFNLGDASDGNQDQDGDGYTNVEEFLNGTDPDMPFNSRD